MIGGNQPSSADCSAVIRDQQLAWNVYAEKPYEVKITMRLYF